MRHGIQEAGTEQTTASAAAWRPPLPAPARRQALPAARALRPSRVPVAGVQRAPRRRTAAATTDVDAASTEPQALLGELGSGAPLDRAARARMEPVLARDLSDVRVHTDATAASLSSGLDARAFTVGRHVAMAAGEYRPGTTSGDALLAHELAHVVQQAGGSSPVHEGTPEYDALEQQADRTAERAVTGPGRHGSAAVTAGRVRGVQRAPAAPSRSPPTPASRLPPARVQRDEIEHGWRFEFNTWVFRYELVAALFRANALPAGFTLDPSRRDEAGGNLSQHWTLRWTGSIADHLGELTDFGNDVSRRILTGGEEFRDETAQRQAEEEAAHEAHVKYNATFVPALGMTGEQALRTLKPGLYVAAPGMPIVPIPRFEWREGPPDVSLLASYHVLAGVFVWVGGATIQIRELGKPASETFWRDMVYFMQHGDDLHTAERHYVELMDQIIRQELMAMAMAYSAAPSIGPRADLAGEAVDMMAGQAAGKAGFLRNIDPAEAVTLAVQTYGVALTLKETFGGTDDGGDARQAEDGFPLPVIIEAGDPAAAATTAAPAVQRAPARSGGTRGGRLAPVRERVDGFVGDLATAYGRDIADATASNPRATPSQIGRAGERATLARVETIARRWNLDPSRIWVGDVPVGVTGPSGGVISAEVGSKFYKFLVELKKSPSAVRPYQARAQLLSIDESVNFPRGGRLFRIYGEPHAPAKRVVVHESTR